MTIPENKENNMTTPDHDPDSPEQRLAALLAAPLIAFPGDVDENVEKED